MTIPLILGCHPILLVSLTAPEFQTLTDTLPELAERTD